MVRGREALVRSRTQLINHIRGTVVAGLIAARDNGLGVRGVAPRATIYGFDLTIGLRTIDDNDKARAAAHQRAITAVYNNSWGLGQSALPKSVSAVWELAVREGVKRGRGGPHRPGERRGCHCRQRRRQARGAGH